ncbi:MULTISPECIES: lipoate--protein ligase family protein [Thermanaerothrix]|nr:lipoate--protein ligase family protein [Thermanaerothrix sp. 4228-RoL]
MRETWRLIRSSPAPGAWNMALDEAILEAVVQWQAPPTLRLYAWNPPCLSLGYAQSFSDVDIEALEALGWDIVRRPTGGRAILHTDELTYAVIAPHDHPIVSGSVIESYRRIAAALVKALHDLGLLARADREYGQIEANGAVCFEVPSNYEITVDGKKIIGSAQARRLQGVLQHGSFPLYGDLTRIVHVLRYDDPQQRARDAERLLEHATTAERVLGYPLAWETAAEAFARAFAETFDLDLREGFPSPIEMQRAEALVREKYANPSWIQHR